MLKTTSTLMAEGLGVREALSHAQHIGITKIWLCSDSIACQSYKFNFIADEILQSSIGHQILIIFFWFMLCVFHP